MPEIDILVPYATKNYILNPSFENNTDGWNAVGSSISAVLTRARFERKALQIVTNDAAVNEGVYYRINDTSLQGVIFASLYIRGEGKYRLRLISGSKQTISPSFDIHDRYWQRVHLQGIAMGLDDLRLYIETAETSQGKTFYIDGVQVERTDYMTTYCDGSQEDCRWNGVSHASTSERNANTPNGGRWVSVRDDECDPTTYITSFSGLGLPPITINRQRMALSPGAFFDSERVEERVIQFGINIKDNYAQRRTGLSKVRLNKLRQHLIDLVKPDRDPNNEQMWMRYRDGDRSLMTRVLYESGLEFDGDFRNKWINTIPLRFLGLDPFWYEDDQEVALLDTETTFNPINLLLARVDGEWKDYNNLFSFTNSDAIYTIEEDVNGNIYIGGEFTQDGDGNNMRRFAVFNSDYTELTEVATGFNDTVKDIVAHPNGKIYICGEFTGDNAGNTFNRIAEYDPDTGVFSALGNGLNGDVNEMDVDANGDLYVCGAFSTAGVVNADIVAKWDGGAWLPVGDPLGDILSGGFARSIVAVDSDEVYLCGNMNAAGPVRIEAVIQYDGTTWTSSGITDVDDELLGLKIKRNEDGNIVAIFSGTVGSGDTSRGIYIYNGGTSWDLQGNRIGISMNDMDLKNRLIYVAGSFYPTYGIPSGLAIWNGSAWVPPDFRTKQTPQTIFVKDNGDVFLGLFYSNNPTLLGNEGGGITYVSSVSTTATFPIITFIGEQTLSWLENQSSNQVSYLDYTILEDEIITFDYRIGEKSVFSNYRGNIQSALLPASEDIFLMPSDIDGNKINKIAVFTYNETDPIVQLRYQPTHWSVDGISRQ